jgi:hypothetical protein
MFLPYAERSFQLRRHAVFSRASLRLKPMSADFQPMFLIAFIADTPCLIRLLFDNTFTFHFRWLSVFDAFFRHY